MADPHNPHKGDKFYFKRTPCTVIGETLKGGGVNLDEAIVQIETAAGTPIVFLYTESARYLSVKPIAYFGKWPLTKAASR